MQAFAVEAFQGLSGRLAVLGVLHCLWIGLVAAAIVAILFQFRHRLSHSSRHTILLLAFFLTALAPWVVALIHYALVTRLSNSAQPTNAMTARSPSTEFKHMPPAANHPVAIGLASSSHQSSRDRSLLAVALSRSIVSVNRIQPMLVAVWLSGSVSLACFLAIGAYAVHRICREASPAPEFVRQIVVGLARRARLKAAPAVMVHPQLSEPSLCGLFRPVILLPQFWLECSEGKRLEAILAHELAHARRLDHLLNLFQRLVEIALFFNPAVHWISCSLRRQREFCADALAVRITGDPLALAEALEGVARIRLKSPGRPTLGSALGGQTISLLPRIQELIGMMPSRPQPRLWPFAALPAAGLVALFAVAVGFAGDLPVASTAHRQTQKNLSERSIIYHFRSFDLNTDALREIRDARARRAGSDSISSAWIVDQREMDGLLEHLHKLNARTIYESGDITAFEKAPVKIKTVDGDPRNRYGKTHIIGSAADFSGQILEGRTRLTLELRVVSPVEMPRPKRKNASNDTTVAAKIGMSPVREGPKGISFDLPQGSTLAMTLALDERESHGAKRTTTDTSAGEGDVHAKQIEHARLFLITPRPDAPGADQTSIPGIKGFFNDTQRTR